MKVNQTPFRQPFTDQTTDGSTPTNWKEIEHISTSGTGSDYNKAEVSNTWTDLLLRKLLRRTELTLHYLS